MPDADPTGPASLLARAGALSTATLHEAMGRGGVLPPAIRALAPAMRVCGPAAPVACALGDNLRIHQALYRAGAGDVLVVAVPAGPEHGYWGEILSVAAIQRGLGGLVIDGCVRDADRLAALGFPVFACGLCVRGTTKDPALPGTTTRPVPLGGVTVHPGDLIVGDRDGVVCVPRAELSTVVDRAEARDAAEAVILERLRAGSRTLDLFDLPET